MMVTNIKNGAETGSRYLEYLPGIYRDDKFMGQYLNIFEDIMEPLENTIKDLYLYFDPLLTPESFVPWFASWFDLTADPTWTTRKLRKLIKSAAMLYRLRGTKKGLLEYLKIYTDSVPEITEYIQGMALNSETKLGVNTRLGSAGTGNHFTVTIELDVNSAVDVNTIKSIIESQKPAHTVYTLNIKRHD